MEHPWEHWPEEVVKSPPYGPAILSARDASRSTPKVAAGVVAEPCERLLSQWEPCFGPIWGPDAKHPPATKAHVGTEECAFERCIGNDVLHIIYAHDSVTTD